MLRALKAILVGIGFALAGVFMIYQSYESDKPETGLIGAGAIILGLLGVFGGVRMLWVPAQVGGSRGEGGDGSTGGAASVPALLNQSRRRVIEPHDCAVELPFDL